MSKTPRTDRLDKNYIMNGGMELFQRGGASSPIAVPSSFDYITCDRFEMKVGGTWTTPESSRSVTAVGTKTRRSHLFEGTPTNVADTFTIRQKIESINALELLDSNFSIGLKYNNNNFTTLTINLYTADVEDDFSAVTLLDTSIITILDDSVNRAAIFENISPSADIARGLMVEFEFSGLGGLTATNLRVSEVKLNIGDFAQEFSLFGRNHMEELSVCQRYFEKSYPVDEAIGQALLPGTNNYVIAGVYNGSQSDSILFNWEKRDTPTVSVYNSSGTLNVVNSNLGDRSVTATNPTKKSIKIDFSGSPDLVSFQWVADAEL